MSHSKVTFDNVSPTGSEERVFELLSCSQGPEGNQEGSYLTMLSTPGFIFGLITITSRSTQQAGQSNKCVSAKRSQWASLWEFTSK